MNVLIGSVLVFTISYDRRGYSHERLDPFVELQDKDVIRVVVRDPEEIVNPQNAHYGVRSYNPLMPQTDLGMSKFYSILKFLVGSVLNNDNNYISLVSTIVLSPKHEC